MRVLVLASTFPRWPGDKQPGFILDFCRHLPDCDVHVLAPGAADATSAEMIDGVHVHRFRYAPLARWQTLAYGGGMLANVRENPLRLLLLPLFLGAMLLAAWRLCTRERIDVIHAHWIIPQGLVAALLRLLRPRTRLVITAHGADAYAFQGRIGRLLKQFALSRSDAVTVVSSQLQHDLTRGFRFASEPQVEPMGIDLARFEEAPTISSTSRQSFCFVGRLVEKKGVGDLLEAYARASARHAALPPLRIVGDGPLRPVLCASAARLGIAARVSFAGWTDPAAVPALMAGSLAVIVPSITASDGDREGLGLVAVEAIAAGTPVIAYDYGAIRDVVSPGANGSLVPQGDIDALAAALVDAAQERLPVIDAVQRERIRTRFDWRRVGARYREIYQKVR